MAKILVVDDEQNLVELMEMVLMGLGYQVLTASNGREALRVIEREKPQLVISDVMMPVMDGYELLKTIRARPDWGAIRVILISAAPINHHLVTRADEIISKPYDIEVIEAMVKQVLKD